MTRIRRRISPSPARSLSRRVGAAALLLLAAAWSPALGDDFDRSGGLDLSLDSLQTIAKRHEALSFHEIEGLPIVLRDARAPLLVVVTDRGNIARFSVSFEFLKKNDDSDGFAPVLVVNRFETLGPTSRGARAARGESVWLFDGFGFDLDTGHVVPTHLGADLVFRADGDDGGALSPVGETSLYSLSALPKTTARPDAGKPSEGRLIRPTDYKGRYRLAASGIWSGTLELNVEPNGEVAGLYYSDLGGEPHKVTGRATETGDHRVEFAIHFPRTVQNFTGWLWNEGKNVIAGTVLLEHQTSSFIAVREGAEQAMDATGMLVVRADPSDAGTRRFALEPDGDRFRLDDEAEARPMADLHGIVAEIGEAAPDARIVVEAPGAASFERVREFLKALEEAGVKTIELAPAASSSSASSGDQSK